MTKRVATEQMPLFGGVAKPVPEVPEVSPEAASVPEVSKSAAAPAPVTRLTKPQIWDKLALKTSEYMREMENAHAQRWSTEWVDGYAESLRMLRGLYVLLVPVDRERVEDFRLAVRKEIVRVEHEMSELHDRIAVTRGDKLNPQALAIGLRHFRLVDQFEALGDALRVKVS